MMIVKDYNCEKHFQTLW